MKTYTDLDLQRLAKSFYQRHPNPNLTWEDHCQELWVSVLEGKDLRQAYQVMEAQHCRMMPGIATTRQDKQAFVLYFSDGFDMAEEPQDTAVYSLTEQAYAEMCQKMYTLIDTLPTDDQTILLLRSFGYTNAELGKVFHCTTNAMKVRAWRLIEKLRRDHDGKEV